MGDGRQAGKAQVKKATFESTKKKEIGVSDLTLLSKISNEAINDNLKLRFEHDEIYVRDPSRWRGLRGSARASARARAQANSVIPDLYWTCLGFGESVPRS